MTDRGQMSETPSFVVMVIVMGMVLLLTNSMMGDASPFHLLSTLIQPLLSAGAWFAVSFLGGALMDAAVEIEWAPRFELAGP